MTCYSFSQIESFAEQGGFPQEMAPVMAAIAMAESSGCDKVQQGQPYGTTGWGLWQITPGNKLPAIGTDNQLLNPVTNAKAALAVWTQQGFGAWSTYNNGAYRQYLPSNADSIPLPGLDPGQIITGGLIPPGITSPFTSIPGAITSAIGGKALDIVKAVGPYLIIGSVALVALVMLAVELKGTAVSAVVPIPKGAKST